MVRTLITLAEEDKRWLERYSRAQGLSMAETVRRALRHYRSEVDTRRSGEVLDATAGLWAGREVDALDHVRRLRDEWDERHR